MMKFGILLILLSAFLQGQQNPTAQTAYNLPGTDSSPRGHGRIDGHVLVNGKAFDGAAVSLLDGKTNYERHCTTAKKGVFHCTSVPGQYTLRVVAGDHKREEQVQVHAGRSLKKDIAFEANDGNPKN